MTFSQGNTKASKLNPTKVYEIREKYATGDYTQEGLSREYGVSISTIRNVLHRVTWQQYGQPVRQPPTEEEMEAASKRLGELLNNKGD
jgi:transposase